MMDNLPTTTILLPSHNPYVIKYPEYRVISREALHVMKMLRLNGCNVIVTPDNGKKLAYVAQKGLLDVFNQPILVDVVLGAANGVGAAVGAAAIAGLVWAGKKAIDTFTLGRKKPTADTIVYTKWDGEQKQHFNADGEPISEKVYEAITNKLLKYQVDYAQAMTETPPDPSHPNPIFVEHSGRIVGWGKELEKREDGIYVPSARILDKKVLKGMRNGTYKGFSIGGLIVHSTCTICNCEYMDCDHFTAQVYDGIECGNRIDTFRTAEISIVKRPANPLTHFKVVAD